ncbi:MAG TPA: MobA/MobL family protein, partial [Rubrobacter sp.]|nr:MobA/MobL family protein [Rubrobacter sp.]
TIAQFDLHHPSRHAAADPRNVHGHLLIPTRSVDERGRFDNGAKMRVLSNRTQARNEVKALRGLWVETVNEELAREGIVREDGSPLRLDPRSYSERGIERIPEVHLGVAATALERQGVPTGLGNQNRTIREDNAELARLDEELAQLERERHLLLKPSAPSVTPGGATEDPKPGNSADHQLDVRVPIPTGLASDVMAYRELIGIEAAERELLDRISKAEQDSRVTVDEALREALEAFGIQMRIAFQDGSGAEKSWREYLTRHGYQEAVATLRDRPERIGALRVRKTAFGLRSDDQAAREAAPRAAEAGARLAQELTRLERRRIEAEERRDRLVADRKSPREWTLWVL